MHDRQEAILHMLAAHEDTRSNDSDSDTASVLSASSELVGTAQRARSFFGGIEQYAAKKNQQTRSKAERTFDDLAKVQVNARR